MTSDEVRAIVQEEIARAFKIRDEEEAAQRRMKEDADYFQREVEERRLKRERAVEASHQEELRRLQGRISDLEWKR